MCRSLATAMRLTAVFLLGCSFVCDVWQDGTPEVKRVQTAFRYPALVVRMVVL